MLIIGGDRRIVGDLPGAIARLESLLQDLERFGSGQLPDDQEVRDAPLLDPFTFGTRSTPCLIGGNHGHPICQGRLIRTSDVWAFAPELGWARTYSRLYRLGNFRGAGWPK